MKISYNWLKQYLHVDLPAEKTAEILTDCGLEVESIEKFQSVKGGLKGCIIGEIKTCVRHPNADKLWLTTVDVGTGILLSIVCGAPNAAAGQKVIVAMVGALLHPTQGEPFEIKKSKIRGEASEGMICAEDEIGLGTSHEGIIVLPADVQIGTPAKEYFKVEDDTIFEIGLTPNRADAASHIGVARDLYAAIDASGQKTDDGRPKIENPASNLQLLTSTFKTENSKGPVIVEVQDTPACPRYSGITISGVEVKESPQWLKNRLLAIGVHPINNIVDITNYVLHECGQPLHAFDVDEIADKKVVVRKANTGEKFITLDGVERTLTSNDLMICSAKEPMCIAGVFGGIKSGITEKTKNVFIESAYFNPASIRKTAKHHGLKTDASFRFERGTDPEITLFALKRAALLIQEIAGGKISGDIVDVYPEKILPKKVEYNFERASAFIGAPIEKKTVKRILSDLNIKTISETDETLTLEIPTYKVDVTREVDVVEEVLRIYGYNKIESPAKLAASLSYYPKSDPERIQQAVGDYLSGNGFFEILTNSLAAPPLEAWDDIAQYMSESENNTETVRILNPLSRDLSMMRKTLLYSGLQAIEYNRNRKNPDLKFFEFGTTYHVSKKGFDEKPHLALFITGKKFEGVWNADKSDTNFFFLKTFVQNVLSRTGINAEALKESSANDIDFKYGLSLLSHDKPVVSFGAVKKNHLKKFDIAEDVFYADFNWSLVLKLSANNKIEYKEASKFPEVKRDLSMIIGADVNYSKIRELSFKTEKILLKEIHLFDVYEGKNIEAGKKSYAISFILRDERQTLTDKQIDKIMNRLMETFEKEAGAVIRKG